MESLLGFAPGTAPFRRVRKSNATRNIPRGDPKPHIPHIHRRFGSWKVPHTHTHTLLRALLPMLTSQETAVNKLSNVMTEIIPPKSRLWSEQDFRSRDVRQ
eukprot:2429936-Amphidinium_carterae.1